MWPQYAFGLVLQDVYAHKALPVEREDPSAAAEAAAPIMRVDLEAKKMAMETAVAAMAERRRDAMEAAKTELPELWKLMDDCLVSDPEERESRKGNARTLAIRAHDGREQDATLHHGSMAAW